MQYATLGLTGAALALSGLTHAAAGAAPHSPASFTATVWWFQGISMNGMLSIDYPPLFRSFCKSFGWSVGMASWRSLQTAIDACRIQTGGNTTVSGVHEFANTTLVYANNTKRELGHNITMEGGGRNFHCNQTSPAPCIRYRVLMRLSNNCLCLARIHS